MKNLFKDIPVRPMAIEITDKLAEEIAKRLVGGMAIRSLTLDDTDGERTMTADIDILDICNPVVDIGNEVRVTGRITISGFHTFTPASPSQMPCLCMPRELGTDPA